MLKFLHPLILLFFIFPQILLGNVGSDSAAAEETVLVLSVNLLLPNYALTEHLVKTLVENGHHVHWAVIQLAPIPIPKELVKMADTNKKFSVESLSLSNRTIETVFFNQTRDPDNDYSEKESETPGTSSWFRQRYSQDRGILHNEAFALFKDVALNTNFIKSMHERHWTLGLFDAWDFTALAIFELIGVPRVIASSGMLPPSYVYGYFNIQLPASVPEIYSTLEGDISPDLNDLRHRHKQFAKNHAASRRLFTSVHMRATKWFQDNSSRMKTLYPWSTIGEFPSLPDIFKRRVTHFLFDYAPSLDMDMLREALAPRMAYIGGITIDDAFKDEKLLDVDRRPARVILVAINHPNYEIIPEKLREKFIRTLVEVFAQVSKSDYKFKWFLPDSEAFKFADRLVMSMKLTDSIQIDRLQLDDTIENFLDPKVRLLVSYCSSTVVMESIASGIPLICYPFQVDDYYIAEVLANEKSVASHLNIRKSVELIKQDLLNALREHLRDIQTTESNSENTNDDLERVRALQRALFQDWGIISATNGSSSSKQRSNQPKHVFLKAVQNR